MEFDVTLQKNFDRIVNNMAKNRNMIVSIEHSPNLKSSEVCFQNVTTKERFRYNICWPLETAFTLVIAGIDRDLPKHADPTLSSNVKPAEPRKPRTPRKPKVSPFDISKVIFNDPATIVFWEDGTKTVVKCQGDDWYSEEVGLAMCFMKKALGNKGNYNDIFRKWVPDEPSNPTLTIEFNGYANEGYLDPNGIHERIKAILDNKEVSDS